MMLAEGETLPTKPVYWLIWVLDDTTQKPYHSRMAWGKHLTMAEASRDAYGIEPSKNMRFFNMSASLFTMRKRLKEISKLWPKD